MIDIRDTIMSTTKAKLIRSLISNYTPVWNKFKHKTVSHTNGRYKIVGHDINGKLIAILADREKDNRGDVFLNVNQLDIFDYIHKDYHELFNDRLNSDNADRALFKYIDHNYLNNNCIIE